MINLLNRDKVLGTPNIIIAIEAAKRTTELLDNISNGTPAEKIKGAEKRDYEVSIEERNQEDKQCKEVYADLIPV